MRRAVDPAEQTAELLAESESRLFSIANGQEGQEPVSIANATREAYSLILARAAGDRAVTGLETGWFDLDALTGGFQPGELVVVGARPSVGKTAFMAGCVLHLASRAIPTLTFSLEQRPVEIGERFLSAWAGVNTHRTRKGTITDADDASLNGALRDFAAFPGHVSRMISVTPRDLLAESRRWKLKHGIRAVFLDYLQLIVPQEVRGIPRHEQVAATTRRLKLMARELQIPVVVLAQLNRDIEEGSGRRPRLSDLKESGAIEQDADTVLFIHRPVDMTDKREIIVSKQRNGPTGDVVLTFRKEFMRFENATPDTPAEWK
jgi:replicative DNA helicase